MQYIYDRYGRHRAGMTATVISYRPRSAMREVGKVFGLSEDVDGSARRARSGAAVAARLENSRSARAGSIPTNPAMRQRAAISPANCSAFPAICRQHVGGFVLTRDRLDRSCRSAMPRWTTAPSSNGTRTTSTRSA